MAHGTDPPTERDHFHVKWQLGTAIAAALITVVGSGAIAVWSTFRARDAEKRMEGLEEQLRQIRDRPDFGPRKTEGPETKMPSSTNVQPPAPVGSRGNPAADSTSVQVAATSQVSSTSEVTVAAVTEDKRRYPLRVRLADLSTTAISTAARISLTNMSSDVLYYKIYYRHELGGGSAFDRFSLVASDGSSQDWHAVEGVQEASPMSYFKNACLLLPPSVEVFVSFSYKKPSPPGRVVVVHTPVRLSQWADCPGTGIYLPEFTLTSVLMPQ